MCLKNPVVPVGFNGREMHAVEPAKLGSFVPVGLKILKIHTIYKIKIIRLHRKFDVQVEFLHNLLFVIVFK